VVSRQAADKAALAVVVLTLIVGGNLVATRGPDFGAPTKTTSVAEKNSGSGLGKRTRTIERTKGGTAKQSGKKTTITIEKPTRKPSNKTTTTTEVSPRSFTERALGDGGFILLEVGIILLAAFLAGAFTQRVLLGSFAIKFGVLELGAVQEQAEKTIVDLTARVASIADVQAQQKKDLEAVTERVHGSQQSLVTIGTALAQISDRVAELEKEPHDGS
jgi:hypothetical protein